MRKLVHKQWFMLTLPGLVFFAALFIGGGAEELLWRTLPVMAAGALGTESGVLAPNRAQQDVPGCIGERRKLSFSSTVVVTSGEVVCSDVTSLGGSVLIRGEVNSDVVTFGGNVVIDGGMVHGNITLYGGDLILENGARVNGDIHVCGGHRAGEANSRLHGSVFACTQSIGQFLAADRGATFRFWSLIAWIALGILLTTLLPEHVMFVRTTARSKMRRSLVLGLLSVLLAPAILTVLIALIIPIPLAILVLIGLVVAWALGTVAIGWLLGDYLLRRIAPHYNTRHFQIVVGIAILTLAGSLPIIGLLISLGSGLLGLGAVFLSRFGTRLYCPPRQPL